MTRATDKTAPDEVAAITAALQGFIPVLEDVDPRQRAYIYTEDATIAVLRKEADGAWRASPASF